jgi:23S rRNA pseudouridine1911/1915/1917 synthase
VKEPAAATVPTSLAGVRLDRVVALLTGLSRSAAASVIAQGAVHVDGRIERRRSIPVAAGSRLEVDLARVPEAAPPAPEPEVEVPVVFVDPDLIVVDKPWDVVVHPGAGRSRGTLVGALLARFPEVGQLATPGSPDATRPGIVHRLDRGTSGLLVVARTPRALRSLRDQLARRHVTRRYVALVHGQLEHDRGLIDAPLGRSPRRPTRMGVVVGGREARTNYTVLARLDEPVPSTVVVATLETGRTHQLRVHFSAIGHPVVGDETYGRADGRIALPKGRFFLHAFELGFDHPADGRWMRLRSPLPAELGSVLPEVPELT